MKKKKLLSLFLCLALMVFMLPTTVLAEESVSVTYLDADGVEQYCGEATKVTADDTEWSDGWYVVSDSITIDTRVTVSGTVHLILADSCSLTVNGGISVNSGNSLTIYGQANDTGSLTAIGTENAAGIGGTVVNDTGNGGGTITINGGIITATAGGAYDAGIGGSNNGSGSAITINGGVVTAVGGTYGSGIGSGGNGAKSQNITNNCVITINGGIVTASGGSMAAGIGGGQNFKGCTVVISGGTITAAGGSQGIGMGLQRGGSSVLGGGSFSTGENGSAFIVASSIADIGGEDDWKGIIIIGTEGGVYGDSITLTADAEVPSETVLIIPEGAILIVPEGSKLTNSGTIVNNGTLVSDGTITGGGTIIGNQIVVTTVYLDYDDASGIFTQKSTYAVPVTSDITMLGELGKETWYVVSGDITISTWLHIYGTVNLILEDEASYTTQKCVVVTDNELTIWGGIEGSGTLNANGATWEAGIQLNETGTLNINGGTVNAVGGRYGAGIGGGHTGSGGTVTINGGTVDATGGSGGEGIGSGSGGSGGMITINGGSVTTLGGSSAAGIGGTFSTGLIGRAFIVTSKISDTSGQENWQGVIIQGSMGLVYGNVTLITDAAVPTSAILTIPEEMTLTIDSETTLTNIGIIYIDGTLNGIVDGTVYYRLMVNGGTAAGTVTYNSKTYAAADTAVTLTADDASVGTAFNDWTVSDTSVTVANNIFTMPAKVMTVTASFVNAPTYTVTIPAEVPLSSKAIISASGVNVAAGYDLAVSLTAVNGTDNAFTVKNAEGATLVYTVTDSSGEVVSVGDAVLTVAGGTADNRGEVTLAFALASDQVVKYSGKYTGTVIFTVSVETAATGN